MDTINKLRSIDEYMYAEKTTERLWTAREEASCPLIGSGDTQPEENTEGGRCENQPTAGADRFLRTASLPVHYAALPNGKHIPLLKTAITTACERNCTYCAFRAGRDFRRQTFQPDELAEVFMRLYRAGIVQGLFLSSGVAGGGIRTQDQLLAAAEILRKRYAFPGYIHLKIMPGAERDQVEMGMRLADRVSVNLEAPNDKRLHRLAPQKQFMQELLEPLKWVDQIRREQPSWQGWNGRWPSSTTQFVVGAIDETDMELLQVTHYLHQSLRLTRVYFSGFSPVAGTPLEHQPGVNPMREVRLYQAAFLLRDYEFDFEELDFSSVGNLPLEVDPKLAWARAHLCDAPVEINQADYHMLIRVPGIGPITAKRIINYRKQDRLSSLAGIGKMGVSLKRAAPFILVNGKSAARQLAFPFFT